MRFSNSDESEHEILIESQFLEKKIQVMMIAMIIMIITKIKTKNLLTKKIKMKETILIYSMIKIIIVIIKVIIIVILLILIKIIVIKREREIYIKTLKYMTIK